MTNVTEQAPSSAESQVIDLHGNPLLTPHASAGQLHEAAMELLDRASSILLLMCSDSDNPDCHFSLPPKQVSDALYTADDLLHRGIMLHRHAASCGGAS